MKKKPFSKPERDQLAHLAQLRDQDIDTVDIPEAPAENWIYARRNESPLRRSIVRKHGRRPE